LKATDTIGSDINGTKFYIDASSTGPFLGGRFYAVGGASFGCDISTDGPNAYKGDLIDGTGTISFAAGRAFSTSAHIWLGYTDQLNGPPVTTYLYYNNTTAAMAVYSFNAGVGGVNLLNGADIHNAGTIQMYQSVPGATPDDGSIKGSSTSGIYNKGSIKRVLGTGQQRIYIDVQNDSYASLVDVTAGEILLINGNGALGHPEGFYQSQGEVRIEGGGASLYVGNATASRFGMTGGSFNFDNNSTSNLYGTYYWDGGTVNFNRYGTASSVGLVNVYNSLILGQVSIFIYCSQDGTCDHFNGGTTGTLQSGEGGWVPVISMNNQADPPGHGHYTVFGTFNTVTIVNTPSLTVQNPTNLNYTIDTSVAGEIDIKW
jgi:hypothetical protein